MAESNEIQNGDELLNVDIEFLEEALCVLADCDPDNCSYSRGYVKRQAVFACKTCTDRNDPAGICLACANKCHEGHDILELYTKRNFRCDCGNGKFGEFQCHLTPSKDAENVKNLYNHNFHGCYCSCDWFYTDTDVQGGNEMIQCVICEDWFHAGHLGCTETESEELQEMVCEACMNKVPFLWTYAAHFAVPPATTIGPSEEEGSVDVEDVCQSRQNENPSISAGNTTQEEEEQTRSDCKRKHEDAFGGVEDAAAVAGCRLRDLERRGLRRAPEGAVFWPVSWRSKLCTCTSCKRAYVSAQVHFLMDPSDTLLAYEARGMEEPFGKHPLLALTDSLSHVQQLEVIYGYQEMTTAVRALLRQCFDEDKPVTEEAVRQCFTELTERVAKRRRSNSGNQ